MGDDSKTKFVKIGITAGVIGAAAGAAAGVLLSDKKNRQKLASKLDQMKKWSDKTVSEWREKMEDIEQHGEDITKEVKMNAKDAAEDIAEEVEDKTKSFESSAEHIN